MADSRTPPQPRLTPSSAQLLAEDAGQLQLQQGLAQTQIPTAAAMQVDLSLSPLPSPSPLPIAAVGRALAVSSAHVQSASPYPLSQGVEPPASVSNGTQRARTRPLPLPEEQHGPDDGEFKQQNDAHVSAVASAPAAAAASASASVPAVPRPQVNIAAHVQSPSLRLPPKPAWAAANRTETTLRGRSRAAAANGAPQPQHAPRPIAAAIPVSPAPSSGSTPRSLVNYTPQPTAGTLSHSRLRESNASSATDLWCDYLAKTEPHADSPIRIILKQVAEQIDWILDCMQAGLETRMQDDPSAAGAQQAPTELEKMSEEQIQELITEFGPKQIHVVLKHPWNRVEAFSAQFARFLSLSPGRSYQELALVRAQVLSKSKSACLPALRPSRDSRRPTNEADVERLRHHALHLKEQGVENHQCMRRAVAQLIGHPAQALATHSALMTLRRAAYDQVHRTYFAPGSKHPGHRVRVMHRLMPDAVEARVVNPHTALQQWTSFSGRVVGVSDITRVQAHPQTDCRGWFQDDESIQLIDVPVQTVWVQAQPFKSAFTEQSDQPWAPTTFLPAVRVELEGELAGQFARGDRVVGYGFVRTAADFAVRVQAQSRVRNKPEKHHEDLDGPTAKILIQANNLVLTNSQEWIDNIVVAANCVSELHELFAGVAAATETLPCHPEARDWIITALIVDSVFRGEVPAAQYKLLRLQMLLSLVSGPGPLSDHDQEDHFHNDEEMEHRASMQGPQAQQQWAMLKASLQRSQPLRDSDLQPLTMLILSGGPVSSKAVPQLVDRASESATDCAGASSSVRAPLRPTRLFAQTEPLNHARDARDALCDEWTVLDVRAKAPLRPSDVGLIANLLTRTQVNPAVSNGASNGVRGRGRKNLQRTFQLTLEMDDKHSIPPTRTSPSGPPHLWLSAPLHDHPKDARAALNKLDRLAAMRLPLTQHELEASRMFDLTAYHHAGDEELKATSAANALKQFLVTSSKPLCAALPGVPCAKPAGSFAAQVNSDPHWKALHDWMSDSHNFSKYIAAARSSKLPRMTAEALALLQNYFNYAVGKTAMAGRVQEVYNPQFNDLARRVAVNHARLHLRRDVNVLDMTVGLMMAEEQAATVHSDVPRALRWNRAEKMFGAFSMEELPQGTKTYCAYTLSSFNKLFTDMSRDAAAHVHTPSSSRFTPNPSATPAGISRPPNSDVIHTDPIGGQQPSPMYPQAAAAAFGFHSSPIPFGNSPMATVQPLPHAYGPRNQQPGSAHDSMYDA